MMIDLKTVMAHKPPMLLVDNITEAGADGAVTVFKVAQDNIFLDGDGVLAREALAEIMAQSLAAFNAFNAAKESKEAGKGFLVGLKNIVFHGEAKAGDEVRCEIKITDFLSQTYIAKGRVFLKDTVLAEGEIRIFTF